MRRHGWQGDLPDSDEEAIRRILDATRACIDRDGDDIGVAVVARELGVTRQTVYRYFRTTEALLTATAIDAAATFLTRLEAHLAKQKGTPADLVVEGVAFTLEQLPDEPYMGLLLSPGRIGIFGRDFTSPAAVALGRSMIDRFPIDWRAHGFDTDDLDDLVEHMLRMTQSFVIAPGTPPRRGEDLRSYLQRWLAPAVRARGHIYRVR